MPIVLTVDDSSSIRSIVGKAPSELGSGIEQAGDGERRLALLEAPPVRALPWRGGRALRPLIELEKDAARLGVQLRPVGTAEARVALRRVTDSAALPVFGSIEAARGLAA